jgi:putative Ca2+/H+ antiporter (TMEM165/GDT1 family)
MLRTGLTTFLAVFVAELGDKTQLAALAFSAGAKSAWVVFAAASLALVASTAIAVGFGQALTRVLPLEWIRVGAAGLFLIVGAVLLIEALPAALRR